MHGHGGGLWLTSRWYGSCGLLDSGGVVLADWGHYTAAIVDLTHALNRRMTARDHANARFVRAFAYGQLGDLDVALKEFAEAEGVVSDHAWLYYYRALLPQA